MSNLSQPATTQAIAKLETVLGTKLFERTTTGMFPTDAGDILFRRWSRARGILRTGAARLRAGRLTDHVSTTQLRALIAVAAHRNYSVAARASGVSQPTLYRAAHSLQAQAGEPLFIKSRSGVDLTPEAQALMRGARLAFAELDHAIDDINHLLGDRSSSLRLGSLPLARANILPKVLKVLVAQQPGTQVTVNEGPFEEQLHALRHGEIDIMLGALRDPVPAPDVVQVRMFQDRLGVFCAPDHPLTKHPRPDLEALLPYPWVVARQGTPTRAHFDQIFDGVTPTIEANAPFLVHSLLTGSPMLAMISSGQFIEETRAGTLYRLNVDLNDTPRDIGATYRRNWEPTEIQVAFLTVLRQVSGQIA